MHINIYLNLTKYVYIVKQQVFCHTYDISVTILIRMDIKFQRNIMEYLLVYVKYD